MSVTAVMLYRYRYCIDAFITSICCNESTVRTNQTLHIRCTSLPLLKTNVTNSLQQQSAVPPPPAPRTPYGYGYVTRANTHRGWANPPVTPTVIGNMGTTYSPGTFASNRSAGSTSSSVVAVSSVVSSSASSAPQQQQQQSQQQQQQQQSQQQHLQQQALLSSGVSLLSTGSAGSLVQSSSPRGGTSAVR